MLSILLLMECTSYLSTWLVMSLAPLGIFVFNLSVTCNKPSERVLAQLRNTLLSSSVILNVRVYDWFRIHDPKKVILVE